MEEYYKLLGLQPGAPIEEVKKYATSYSHYYHPENLITGDIEMYNKVQEAYTKICRYIQNENLYEENKNSINKKGLLDEYIYWALVAYGTIDNVTSQLDGYVRGIEKAITSTNNFRNRFKANLSASDINEITSSNIKGYITNKSWSKFYFEAFSKVYNEYGKEEFAKYLNELASKRPDVNEYCESLLPENYAKMLDSIGYQVVDFVIDDLSLEYFKRLNEVAHTQTR